MLHTFQQYFFMAAGDWAENLAEALCAHTAQHGLLHEHSMQSMLDSSFKGTSVELDPSTANLRTFLKLPSSSMAVASLPQSRGSPGSSRPPPARSWATASSAGRAQQQPSNHNASVTVDGSQLKALEAVQLSFDVQWPLSLIITQVQHLSVISRKVGSIANACVALCNGLCCVLRAFCICCSTGGKGSCDCPRKSTYRFSLASIQLFVAPPPCICCALLQSWKLNWKQLVLSVS